MKLENQVCTKIQGEKLESLGVSLKPIFCWCYVTDSEGKGCVQVLPTEFEISIPDAATTWISPAFTVAELGVMLPAGYDTMYCSGEGWKGYDLDGNYFFADALKTESEMRALMLIELLQRNMVTPEECNKRLLES